MHVIVTDCDSRLGYTVAYSLFKAGYQVHGICEQKMAHYSRIFKSVETLPSIFNCANSWVKTLIEKFPCGGFIFPISMEMNEFLLANRDAIDERFSFSSLVLSQFIIAKNKLLMHDVCEKIGIPIPKTWDLSIKNIENLSIIELPCIVKRVIETGFRPEERYEIITSAIQLQSSQLIKSSDTVAQKIIRGPGFGVGLCAHNGEIKEAFIHKRLREEIFTGGPSTYCEKYQSAKLIEYCKSIVKYLNWTGLAMLEFKQEVSTGDFYFLEMNPRPWGSIQLPFECGTNFASIAVELFTGCAPPKKYRANPNIVRLKLVRLDVKAAYREFEKYSTSKWLFLNKYIKEYMDRNCKYVFNEHDVYKLSLLIKRKLIN